MRPLPRPASPLLHPGLLLPLALLGLGIAVPAGAQSPGALASALDDDLREVQEKMVSLGRAIPAEEWDWRPAPGVRSVEEVLKHVAWDNFYFPTAVGVAAPEGTGITAEYATARAWGDRPLDREEILEALDASFTHLRGAISREGRGGALSEPVSIFGREMDRRRLWILATTHAHEHLGQLIAYARTRGVAPPWSGGP